MNKNFSEINLGKYKFIYDGRVIVDYQDGNIIEVSKLNVVSVCITLADGLWVVNIITKEALQKLKMGITNNLEVVGFKFEDYMDSILAHNFLTLHLLAPETAKETQTNKDE
jgi:molybdopterin-binding protein